MYLGYLYLYQNHRDKKYVFSIQDCIQSVICKTKVKKKIAPKHIFLIVEKYSN